jgi:hypothetical protein
MSETVKLRKSATSGNVRKRRRESDNEAESTSKSSK